MFQCCVYVHAWLLKKMCVLLHSWFALHRAYVGFYSTLCSSPILGVAEYREEEYFDGTMVPVCLTRADSFWPVFFFVSTISLFFVIPLAVLIVLYSVIARHLTTSPVLTKAGRTWSGASRGSAHVLRYRRQVVLMLGTVVLSFFLCLLPFRALTLWIIIVPPEAVMSLGIEGYYNLLYFCRIMLYLNSAINPILYNVMSTKFREGFGRLCGIKKGFRYRRKNAKGASGHGDSLLIGRTGTLTNTTSTSCSTSGHQRTASTSESAVARSSWRRAVNGSSCPLGSVVEDGTRDAMKLQTLAAQHQHVNAKNCESYV